MKHKEIVKLALEVAKLRHKQPRKAERLEHVLYNITQELDLPESETRYILELAEPRVYQ